MSIVSSFSLSSVILANRVDLLGQNNYSIEEIDAVMSCGRTAIQLSAVLGRAHIAKRLLQLGADPKSCTSMYGSALCQAVLAKQPQIVELLMSYSANEICAKNSDSPYHAVDSIARNLFQSIYSKDAHIRRYYQAFLHYPSNFFKSYLREEKIRRILCYVWDIDWNLYSATGIKIRQKITFRGSIDQHITPRKGAPPHFFLKKIAKNCDECSKLFFSEVWPYQILQNACEMFCEELTTPEMVMKNVAAGKPAHILMTIQSPSHVVSVVFYDAYLCICNLGAGAQRSVELFSYNQNTFPKDLLLKFFQNFESLNDYAVFLHQVSENATRMPFEPLLYRSFQTIGNCTWKSPETALYCYMFLYAFKKADYPSNLRVWKNCLSFSLTLASLWLNNYRLITAEKYLDLLLEKDRRFFSNIEPLYWLKFKFDQTMPSFLPETLNERKRRIDEKFAILAQR